MVCPCKKITSIFAPVKAMMRTPRAQQVFKKSLIKFKHAEKRHKYTTR